MTENREALERRYDGPIPGAESSLVLSHSTGDTFQSRIRISRQQCRAILERIKDFPVRSAYTSQARVLRILDREARADFYSAWIKYKRDIRSARDA